MRQASWCFAMLVGIALPACGGSVNSAETGDDDAGETDDGTGETDEAALNAATTIATFDPVENLAIAFERVRNVTGDKPTTLLRVAGTPTAQTTRYKSAQFKWVYSFASTVNRQPVVLQVTYPGWRTKTIAESGLGASLGERAVASKLRVTGKELLAALARDRVTCPLAAITLRGNLSPFRPGGVAWFWEVRCTGTLIYDPATAAKLNEVITG